MTTIEPQKVDIGAYFVSQTEYSDRASPTFQTRSTFGNHEEFITEGHEAATGFEGQSLIKDFSCEPSLDVDAESDATVRRSYGSENVQSSQSQHDADVNTTQEYDDPSQVIEPNNIEESYDSRRQVLNAISHRNR